MNTKLCRVLNFLLICLHFHTTLALWESVAGPFYLRLQSLIKCADKPGENPINFTAKIDRFNWTHQVLSTNVTFPIDLSNDVTLRYTMNKKTTAGRYSIVFSKNMKTCDAFNIIAPKFVEAFFAAADTTYECPIKQGTYYVDSLLFNLRSDETIMIPSWEYGDYIEEFEFFKDNDVHKSVLQFCFAVHVQLRPLAEILKKTS